jgi:hypothetical protein
MIVVLINGKPLCLPATPPTLGVHLFREFPDDCLSQRLWVCELAGPFQPVQGSVRAGDANRFEKLNGFRMSAY